MKKKVLLVCSAALVLAMILVSAYVLLRGSPPSPLPNSDLQPADFFVLLDDSVVFFSFGNGEGHFYRQFFDGSYVEIGEISDFVFSRGCHAKVGDKLYFCITTGSSVEAVIDGGGFVNHIYCIDLKENRLYEEYAESECLPGAFMVAASTRLISRQSIRTENNIVSTWLEAYDLETHQVVKTGEAFLQDTNTNVGTHVMNLCSDGQYIYALVVDMNGDDWRGKIWVYDQDLELVDKINMDQVADILSNSVAKMSISRGYIYMGNTMPDGVVARVEDGVLVPVIQRHRLRDSVQFRGEYPVFFIFDSLDEEPMDVYLYDEDSEEFHAHRMNLKDGYHISVVMRNEDKAFVYSFAYAGDYGEAPPDRMYLVDVSDIPDIR